MKRKAIVLFFAAIILTLCSCTTGPSDKDVEGAIAVYLIENMPPHISGSFLGYSVDSLKIVSITERGNYNKKEDYWPVKATIRVKTHRVLFSGGTEPHQFNGVVKFKIYKDDYGKWKAVSA